MPNATPKVRFFCYYCYEPVSAPEKFIGKKGQCPRCGKLTVIPPTSTRGPNRAALAKNIAVETDEFVTSAEKEGATLAPTESGAPGSTALAPVPSVAAAHHSADDTGTQRASTNGAPATGPAAPRPVIETQKIEVWKEVFRGKPAAARGNTPAGKATS